MDRCGQELCRNWAGDAGCVCDVLDIEPDLVGGFNVDADEMTDRLILRHAREFAEDEHLRTCPDLTVTEPSAWMSSSDTGAEHTTLDAVLDCPHGHHEEFTYGEWGDLSGMIECMLINERKVRNPT